MNAIPKEGEEDVGGEISFRWNCLRTIGDKYFCSLKAHILLYGTKLK